VPRSRASSTDNDSLSRALDSAKYELAQKLNEAFAELMKQPQGFTKTLKSLNKGRIPTETGDIFEGVYERQPSGRYDLAVQTDTGPLYLRNAEGSDSHGSDPQLLASRANSQPVTTNSSVEWTAGELLRQLVESGANPPVKLLCSVELTRFEASQHEVLLPLLWKYILDHRDSNNRDELVATGAAVRKYIAVMPMNRIDELAVLLESGHSSPLPIDLEIEVAKMVLRNFEVYPPPQLDLHLDLARRLWEIAQAYINPRVLLRDKHAAAASLAIESVVAMRSSLAIDALRAAANCPYNWFGELVSDDLDDLHESWSLKMPEAAAWLVELRSQVLVPN
jgi:hypothetical protein